MSPAFTFAILIALCFSSLACNTHQDKPKVDDGVEILRKHCIRRDKTKNWQGTLWVDARNVGSGHGISCGIRLTNVHESEPPPTGKVTFSLFLVEGREKKPIRQLSLSPKWSRTVVEGGYHEIEYAENGFTVARESKEKDTGNTYSWETLLKDPLQSNVRTGGKALPLGDYSVDVQLTLGTDQLLMFRNVTFRVDKHRP